MKVMQNLLLLLILSPLALVAQTATIAGRVSADNKPLAGAQVLLKETSYYSLSKADGTFEIVNVPYGSYTVVVLFEGKKTSEQALTVNTSSVDLSIIMEDFGQVLDEVLIQDQREQA